MTITSPAYCQHCGGPSIYDYCSADCESHAGDERNHVEPIPVSRLLSNAGGIAACEVPTVGGGGVHE